MTDIRPELSRENPYWIDKHRYYELKHFCLQYPLWKRIRSSIDSNFQHPYDGLIFQKTNLIADPVLRSVEIREIFESRILMIEDAAKETDMVFAKYITRAVTEELRYENLRAVYSIPCCREKWYKIYRKFFYILHNARR